MNLCQLIFDITTINMIVYYSIIFKHTVLINKFKNKKKYITELLNILLSVIFTSLLCINLYYSIINYCRGTMHYIYGIIFSNLTMVLINYHVYKIHMIIKNDSDRYISLEDVNNITDVSDSDIGYNYQPCSVIDNQISTQLSTHRALPLTNSNTIIII